MQQWEEQHAPRPEWSDEQLAEYHRSPHLPPADVRMPCPEGLDPAKWAQLDRRTRRQLQRFHVKQQRRAAR